MRQHEISARRDLLTRLAGLPMFAGIDAATLSEVANALQWVRLPGGEMLFDQAEESDALYLLLYGRLAATRVRADGSLRSVGSISPGEFVGEIGLIAQEARTARVTALRDSELLRLPRQAFERLLARHPQAMLGLARTALRRAHSHPETETTTPHCFAVLGVSPGVDVRGFAGKLAQALGTPPDKALVDAALGRDRDAGWFSARESSSRHILYVGDDDPAWRDRCLRQSDCVLLVANGAEAPQPLYALPAVSPHLVQHLVLQQAGEPLPGRARAWCAAYPHAEARHHLRDTTDLARLARRVSGRAIGLVLSGGGARGFAHIGVVRALREAGVAIDYVGGASIGAVIGAGVAADWSHEQMVETYRRCFYDTNPLSDWTFPFVALRRGRKVSQLLREAFGDRDIEDLPLPFYAVSTNLTAGALNVHESGTLWPALRATCAIPGVLPPVFRDGQILVDGGVIDNLPVDEMRRRMAGEIVACDVGGSYRLETIIEETELPPTWRMVMEWYGPFKRRRPSVAKILLRAGMVNSEATVQRRRKQTALLLKPKLPGVDLLEWREFHRAIDMGYQYTLRQVGGPKDALSAETPVIG